MPGPGVLSTLEAIFVCSPVSGDTASYIPNLVFDPIEKAALTSVTLTGEYVPGPGTSLGPPTEASFVFSPMP